MELLRPISFLFWRNKSITFCDLVRRYMHKVFLPAYFKQSKQNKETSWELALRKRNNEAKLGVTHTYIWCCGLSFSYFMPLLYQLSHAHKAVCTPDEAVVFSMQVLQSFSSMNQWDQLESRGSSQRNSPLISLMSVSLGNNERGAYIPSKKVTKQLFPYYQPCGVQCCWVSGLV